MGIVMDFQPLRVVARRQRFMSFLCRKFLDGAGGFDALLCDAANSLGVAVALETAAGR